MVWWESKLQKSTVSRFEIGFYLFEYAPRIANASTTITGFFYVGTFHGYAELMSWTLNQFRELFKPGLLWGGLFIPFTKSASVRTGGVGANFVSSCIAIEELAKIDPAVSAGVDVHNTVVNNTVSMFGDDQIKERFLPGSDRFIRGKVHSYTAYAYFERANSVRSRIFLPCYRIWCNRWWEFGRSSHVHAKRIDVYDLQAQLFLSYGFQGLLPNTTAVFVYQKHLPEAMYVRRLVPLDNSVVTFFRIA